MERWAPCVALGSAVCPENENKPATRSRWPKVELLSSYTIRPGTTPLTWESAFAPPSRGVSTGSRIFLIRCGQFGPEEGSSEPLPG